MSLDSTSSSDRSQHNRSHRICRKYMVPRPSVWKCSNSPSLYQSVAVVFMYWLASPQRCSSFTPLLSLHPLPSSLTGCSNPLCLPGDPHSPPPYPGCGHHASHWHWMPLEQHQCEQQLSSNNSFKLLCILLYRLQGNFTYNYCIQHFCSAVLLQTHEL